MYQTFLSFMMKYNEFVKCKYSHFWSMIFLHPSPPNVGPPPLRVLKFPPETGVFLFSNPSGRKRVGLMGRALCLGCPSLVHIRRGQL